MQYKHIVYLITFPKRKIANTMPYYYIGSKSNCIFDGTHIFGKNKKRYFGSSKADGYKEAIIKDSPVISVLSVFDNYDECIRYENFCHIVNNVVADPRYWNLSNANENNYANPNYATYKHINTGKTVRLLRDHPMVLSSEYVGVTKGMEWFTDGVNDTYFYSKDTPDEWYKGRTKTDKIVRGDEHYMRKTPLTHDEVMRRCEVRSNNMANNPEKYALGKANQAAAASKTFKDIPKSKESNEKRSVSNKGYVTLKNKDTGESIRIQKNELINYDLSVWLNPNKLCKLPSGNKWYNNGIEEHKFFPNEVPPGYTQGRKKN